jgi:serine phosphatase RsbU (regulator of sigma subunit)/anti-sigma regulatory factor (Ser/Thr protein kinase)
LRVWLPRGNTLPFDVWQRRHRGIVALLWVHAVVIPAFGLVRGVKPAHLFAESLIVPMTAAYAAWPGATRRMRTVAASVGLLSASAILVHFSGGVIEMHFHFFVMVAVVSLYQDWLPFLTAVAYVFVHHAVLGSVDPKSVFNHPAAWHHPWKWAGIHALFIAGISVACLVAWRLNEDSLELQRLAEERLRQETDIVDTLHRVGRSVAAELDLHTVLQRVTDAATELTDAQFGAFFYNAIDASGKSYQLYTLSGVPAEAFAGFPMPRATAVFAPTFNGERVVRYADVTAEPDFGKSAPHFGMPQGHLPVRSYLAVPVAARDGEVYGGLFFGHGEVDRFSEVHERIVVGIASHATVAIENARLYDSERRARASAEEAGNRLRILARAGQVLAGSTDVTETFTDLTRLLTPELSDNAAVYLLDKKGELTAVASHANYPSPPGAFSGGLADRDAENPLMYVLRSGESLLLPDIDAAMIESAFADPADRAFVRETEPTSAILVPLRGPADVTGVLVLGTVLRSGRRLGEADLAIAEELARRVAVALENARLYAAQRDVAETLQHSLLPEELPMLPGLATAARYSPGGPGVEVGGDWYDVLSFGDGTLGVVMGDVVGRGVPAASLMGQIRNALRAYAVEDRDPRSVLQRLNSLVNDLGPVHAMATLVFGIYDLDTGTLRLANAGHPPPVVAANGRASFVEGGLGPPLGAVRAPVYGVSETRVDPGATIVMYTDGLVEDRDVSLASGLDQMKELVASGPSDVEELCDHIMRCALDGRAGGRADDAALLVLQVLPVHSEIRLTVPRRPEVIRALRTTLRRQLHRAGVSPEEEFEILVAAGEACANAIQHAGPASPTFEFESTVDSDVHIVVRDSGRWRDQRPSEGGRGLTIMEQFMDSVHVDRAAAGTEVQMRRALSPVESGSA